MPAENLPIQNINNSYVGFLFGSANSSVYVTEMPGTTTTAEANTRMFIFGKGNGISGVGINETIGAANSAKNSCWVDIFGAYNIASGQYVMIHGGNNDVNNNIGGGASMAIGHSNHISGTNNYAVGCNNMITGGAGYSYGYDNFVFGHSNNISGASNIVFGGGNDISGGSNFVYGCFVGPGDSVSGNYNIAFDNYGFLEISGNCNILAGQNSYVTGSNNVLVGNNLKFDARNNPQITIFGQYNETTAYGTGSPYIFLVANGQSDGDRSDAFTINLNGETSAKDFIDENGKKLSETLPIHLVTTVAEATAGYVNGHVYIVTGSNS